ncbi:ATP synthase subunit delta, chloroplastic [Rhodamnia argentea]|uniref:ATP synthase subunit delta, chloroplastic n=1 Tax=Rhodamnia argentea TaxID=178133 RepID=A0A8B8QWX3_9MYRT|nr:ATP synthase subunit delta, chloroplastic [Rhodamnia argentea]XP_048131152.1 ATP synthase subunit delta, chloroplastic [Rhodamnia argentea]
MAALQQIPFSLQSKIPSPKTQFIHKPSNLSFSATFPSLKLAPARLRHRPSPSAAGARMSATAAASYAAALADVAKSNNTLDVTSADVEKVEKIFSEEGVLEFFSNPTVGLEKKREVVDEISASSGLQPHTANFLNILIEAKRIDLIKDIVKEFETVHNTLTETELAVVSSVVKLESQHLAHIAKQVQKLTGAKNVRIKTVIDPSLVAGFTIRYGSSGSKLIDMSVKKQLEDIAAQLDLGDIQLAV